MVNVLSYGGKEEMDQIKTEQHNGKCIFKSCRIE
jgi:hypothetical protein